MPLAASRAFFAPRARGWEERFPDDDPRYEAAVAALDLDAGATVLDAGCGSGRALVPLRAAVGPSGMVIGVDATDEMLDEAARLGRRRLATLIVGDAARLPLADGAVDAVFIAGLISHLDDPVAGLAELARVARTGADLAVFHPIGRVALAARHGRALSDDATLAPARFPAVLAAGGWTVQSIDDTDERYLALAVRADSGASPLVQHLARRPTRVGDEPGRRP